MRDRRTEERIALAAMLLGRDDGADPGTDVHTQLAVLHAWLRRLATGPAELVLVTLEDLWLEPDPAERAGNDLRAPELVSSPGTCDRRAGRRRRCRGRAARRRPEPGLGPMLTEHDVHLFHEGRLFEAHRSFGAHPEGRAGTRCTVWAPHAAVGGRGQRRQRMGSRRGRPRAGDGRDLDRHRPGAGARPPLQAPDRDRARGDGRQGRPVRVRLRGCARERVDRGRPRVHVGRRRVDGSARGPSGARHPHVGLRAAPRVVAAAGRARTQLRRHRRRAGRPRRGSRLHPRRAAAGHGAPVLRIVGLPDHRVLRAHEPLREPARPDAHGRPPAPARHRRDPRLGAVALPHRRVRTGRLRRHAAVRVRAPGAAPRLEHAAVRLRASRGAVVPREQRPPLARPVPRRRPPRGRRRVHALPRLLTRPRAVDAQRARRQREPRRDRLPRRAEPRGVPRASRHPDRRRGVDGLSRRVPSRRRRRAGLRREVGHGMDARHPRVPRPGSGAPWPPSRRDHVPLGVCVVRALRAAAVARRGGARQGLAAHQDARRPLAAARQPADAARHAVRAARPQAPVHGHRAGTRAGVEPRGDARLVAPRPTRARRRGRVAQGSERHLPPVRAAARARRGPGRVPLGRARRGGAQRLHVPALGCGSRPGARRGERDPGGPVRPPRRRPRRWAVDGAAEQRRRGLRREWGRQPRWGRRDRRAGPRLRPLADARAPTAGRRVPRPGARVVDAGTTAAP